MNKLFLALLLALAPAAFASTWYVDGVHGNDNNDCKTPQTACRTITHAISKAAAHDSIDIGPATYTEHLIIQTSVNLIGSGANTTLIDGGGRGTVVTIPKGPVVTISNVSIVNGAAAFGGGINNLGTLTFNKGVISGNTAWAKCNVDNCQAFAGGGGIETAGTMTINGSTIADNHASVFCTGKNDRCGAGGGGISNGYKLLIQNSTISDNSAGSGCTQMNSVCLDGSGGGISSDGTASIVNSTISGNSAGGTRTANPIGGGVFNGRSMIIQSTTISGNTARQGEDIANSDSVSLQNTIVGNCYNSGTGKITSWGYNLNSDNSCKFTSIGDMSNTDPMLGPLQNNRGPTQTMALLPGSPAIDAGEPSGCTDANGQLLKIDQRGAPRPDQEDNGIGCDIGAFERQSH